jgi:hypothetical protein
VGLGQVGDGQTAVTRPRPWPIGAI